MDEKIQHLIYLIQNSDLDDTIKEILIRDLQTDGLTDFLREQIKAYCADTVKKIDARIDVAKQILEERGEADKIPAE